jgi:hypothetical protein
MRFIQILLTGAYWDMIKPVSLPIVPIRLEIDTIWFLNAINIWLLLGCE